MVVGMNKNRRIMKRVFVLFALMSTALAACNKVESLTDDNAIDNSTPFTLKAYTEDIVDSKATIDGSLNIVWGANNNDFIRVALYEDGEYTPWEREFKLTAGGGTSNGTFSLVGSGTPGENTRYNAIYPEYENTFTVSETVHPETAIIKLLDSYGWTENTILAPMVAYGTAGDAKGLHFKHVGGAVKVTLKNVPVGATKVSLTSDKYITGTFNYTVANIAKVEPDAITTPVENGGNTVSFTFSARESEGDMVFYFPTPALTAPSFTITVYVGDAEIWSKSTKSAQSDITRGDLLVMKPITVTPHYLYVLDGGVITGMTDKSWPSTRQIYADGQNFNKLGTETFGSYTYNKFMLPLSVIGSVSTIYYKEGASGNYQVALNATLSSGTNSHYFSTNGCAVAEVSTPSTPVWPANGIWARHTDSSTTGISFYAWGDVTTGAFPGAAMSATASKYDGKTWYFFAYPSTGDFSGIISYDSKQTADITGLNTSNSYYYDVWIDGESISYYTWK